MNRDGGSANVRRRLALLATWMFLAGCPGSFLKIRPCVAARGLQARCGTYLVPEDRDLPWSRKIALNLVVVPATGKSPAPDPIFFLAGGPGEAATMLTRVLAAGAFKDLRRRRALVLVDQRGTGRSGALACDLVGKEDPYGQALRLDLLPPARLRSCLRKLRARPQLYTTPIAMDDLDAVRSALGYRTINLFGGSYGTRAALVYMRRYPKRVRAAVLSNVSPPHRAAMRQALTAGSRAFAALTKACALDRRCREAFPDPAGDLRAILASLPRVVKVGSPRTGKSMRVTVTPALVRLGLRALMYSSRTATAIPLVLKGARAGDFGPLLGAVGALGSMVLRHLTAGMYLTVWCSEYVPLYTPADRKEQDQTLMGMDPLLTLTQRACAHWPTDPQPGAYFEPIRSDVPTLLLSGELDPATPPSVAAEVARYLPRARQVVFARESHRIGNDECFGRLISRFFERPDRGSLDTSCAKKSPRLRFQIPPRAGGGAAGPQGKR